MIKELKFHDIIDSIIGEINEANRKSNSIHKAGNIKSSGDEVEDLIREKISLFLPERYLVRQGHIINSEGKVSNQFDIIVFDRSSTPKFFESKNNTVFYPIESALAVGEIKKTLRSHDILDFGKKIRFLKVDMNRKLYENPLFEGKIEQATVADIVNMGVNKKYKNPLFSFIFSIDTEDTNKLKFEEGGKFMPNDIYILNHGFFLCGKNEQNTIIPQNEDQDGAYENIYEIKKPGAICLATMLESLITHLNACYIESFGLSHYMTDQVAFRIAGSDVTSYKISKK